MSKQETDGFKPYFIHKQILGKRMTETVWMPGNPGVLEQLSISSGQRRDNDTIKVIEVKRVRD